MIRLLEHHPWFEIRLLAASEASAGRRYADVVRWRETTPLPERIGDLVVQPSDRPSGLPLVFSALDTQAAATIEPLWAASGSVVVTNASPFRLAPDVPLIIPEVNAEHLELLAEQRKRRGWRGAIVANPNCTTTGLALVLAPLHRAFGVDRIFVSTMQAISGAGWPGVASLDILGNVIPFIAGEEEKVEQETRKLLGSSTIVSVHTNRVPVIDGHTETVSIGFSNRVAPEAVTTTLSAWRASDLVRALPSSPAVPVVVETRPDRPQPRLDLDQGGGMSVTVGRIRPCPLLDVRLVLLCHNTVRGAAGATIQNAELLVSTGVVAR